MSSVCISIFFLFVICRGRATSQPLYSSAASDVDKIQLLNYKNYYVVPFGMDNYEKKPKSMVCDFDKACQAIEKAQKGEEIIKKIY